MNRLIPILPLSVLALLGAGCRQEQAPPLPLPPAAQELQKQPVPEATREETRGPVAVPTPSGTATALYRGSWFDVKYPQTFSAVPKAPATSHAGETVVQTDEATFTAADGAVEFFVYSPLWSGTPSAYLAIAPTETLVDEKTEESAGSGVSGGTRTHWVTVKAKDGSYHRSFVSIRRQLGTGSELHHVFGIKYRDAAAYESYKAAYVSFKQSLRQYAD